MVRLTLSTSGEQNDMAEIRRDGREGFDFAQGRAFRGEGTGRSGSNFNRVFFGDDGQGRAVNIVVPMFAGRRVN
jgi:hypothetical protein